MARKKNKYRMSPEIDMGPFADIAFLLIIFFLVTTSISKPLGRLVDLPAVKSDNPQAEEQKNLTVNVLANRIQFGQDEDHMKETTTTELRSALLMLKLPDLEEKKRMVVVNLGDDVPFEKLYPVITAISKAGGIVTFIEEEDEKEGSS